MRFHVAALLAVLASSVATAKDSLPDRHEVLVATTPAFAFYSDPLFNAHDFLVWNARSREPVDAALDCLAALPADERAAFEHAREHYKVFATPAGERLLLAVRYRLAGFPDSGLADAAAIEAALAEVRTAAPAYRKCWWPAHDARNRRWIAELQPLLAEHESALSKRLGKLYGKKLEQPLPVDVVSYSSFGGANTIVDPNHLLVSSVEPANQGYAALEVVFHEASHTLFGPRLDGRLWAEFDAAAKADGLSSELELSFWHSVLFYTTGSAVKARLAERGVTYDQFLYSQKLFQNSWPAFRASLERVWPPYIDGRASMGTAVKQLIRALELPDRGDAVVAQSHTFVFHSDARANLHDFLLWNARAPAPIEPKPECLAGLPTEQRAAFERARDYYAKAFANGGGELIQLSMHWRLARFGDISITDPAQIAATIAELDPAMPAYRACWWREHDARNRRWIADVLPLLAANEDALRLRLTKLYGRDMQWRLPVDVVGYAGADGGSTVLNPHQVLVSSASSSGYSSLEALFREASYTLFSMRTRGALWDALQQASSETKKPIPEYLPRALLFFTTEAAVKARLAEQGIRDYRGVFEKSASANREVLERVWKPYVDGRVPMADAARQLVEALPADSR